MTEGERKGAVEGFVTSKDQFITSEEATKIYGAEEKNALEDKFPLFTEKPPPKPEPKAEKPVLIASSPR